MSSVPQYFPTPCELDDLELLSRGVLAPLRGFEDASGRVTLRVPPEVAEEVAEAAALELVDAEGVPLATVEVTSTYPAGERVGIVGDVTVLANNESDVLRQLYLSPAQVRDAYGEQTLAVPVARPLSASDLEHIRRTAAGRTVLLLALAGRGRRDGLSRIGMIRSVQAAAALLPEAYVVAVPLAPRGEAATDEWFLERIVSAYAPGEVIEVDGSGELPDEVSAVAGLERTGGLVLFFTGLSGSGKSTLARALHNAILGRGERAVTSLDGDVVRRNLSAGLSFSIRDREINIRRIGWVAAEVSRHGGMAICSPIAPFDATRRQVRAMAEEAGGTFFLIHVATPLKECERRDRKGLYAKARRGEIPDFTGVSSPYEEPVDADVRVDTTGRSIDDVLAEILEALADAGYSR